MMCYGGASVLVQFWVFLRNFTFSSTLDFGGWIQYHTFNKYYYLFALAITLWI